MASYITPGVYVEEVPSAEKPIAGAGTSTPVFVGASADSYQVPVKRFTEYFSGDKHPFTLSKFSTVSADFVLSTDPATMVVKVKGQPVTGVTVANNVVTLATPPQAGDDVMIDYVVTKPFTGPAVGDVKLCTNFGDFVRNFGDFSLDPFQGTLARAVYGFFNNGGAVCYVVRGGKDNTDIDAKVFERLKAIEDIALFAAPGYVAPAVRDAIITHCSTMGDRFAILDCQEGTVTETSDAVANMQPSAPAASKDLPGYSDYAAFYFPWIKVVDPSLKLLNPASDGQVWQPPSGHLAGVYARTDNQRGVHKAPANEVVMGALDLKYRVSKEQQGLLNPIGVNCIRDLNGNIRVWGARTMGGDNNADLKYINVRRTLMFLRKSIEQGTQWVVFEPNNDALWAKINRNISSFLTMVWRQGALFGMSPAEAFYVKCDRETNPPAQRDLGQVVTEIGVSIVRPAEFVIFRISQWSGPGK